MPNSSKKNEYQNFGGRGMDVGINRADDLDKKLLNEISINPNCTVLDIGCGAGGQAKRMKEAGAKVAAIDSFDFSNEFTNTDIEYIRGDIRNIKELLGESRFSYAICQRAIHYLRYEEAVVLLKQLNSIVEHSLYISVTGLGSEIGNNYPDKIKKVTDRFCRLEGFAQELFGITEPVCLYSQEEFVALLKAAGWEVEKCWQSAFGNVKAICR